MNLIPWFKKYKCNPVTGENIQFSELIYLNFYKNKDGEFHCPITNQVFTEHSHIVTIKQTGNVYAMKAIEELNVKTKNWKELISGISFTRKDIISLQDPHQPNDPSTYHFVKLGLTVQNKAKISSDPLSTIVVNSTSESVFKEMKVKNVQEKKKRKKRKSKKLLKKKLRKNWKVKKLKIHQKNLIKKKRRG
jgi:peptidyl-prolyl cis-trans isomerase-like protein 2